MATNTDSSSDPREMVADKWSQTASLYERYFEPTCLVLGRFLLNCMKLQYQDTIPLVILEAGAGTGGLAKELVCNLEGMSLMELVVTDIADGMLEQATKKLQGLANVKVEKADFTEFPYANETFDRYYANLCLCYAPHPDIVIQEAHRVLKPGGIAGFTAWGRSKDSPLMTIVPNVLQDLRLEQKDSHKRSSFHLGEDDEGLRSKFIQHGFIQCTIMHYPAAMECFDAESFVELIIEGAASTKKQVASFSLEDQKRVREAVYGRAKAILDKGMPIVLDIVIIVARK